MLPLFLCPNVPFLALGVTLGVTIRGYILCVVMFVFRGYIFIYFGVTLGVTFAVFFFLLRDRETDYLSKFKSIFSVLGWGNCHHFAPSHIIIYSA